jgi:hypothetical protein
MGPAPTQTPGAVRDCLDACLTRHVTPHISRHRCGGQIGRRTLSAVWRLRQAYKQPLKFSDLQFGFCHSIQHGTVSNLNRVSRAFVCHSCADVSWGSYGRARALKGAARQVCGVPAGCSSGACRPCRLQQLCLSPSDPTVLSRHPSDWRAGTGPDLRPRAAPHCRPIHGGGALEQEDHHDHHHTHPDWLIRSHETDP